LTEHDLTAGARTTATAAIAAAGSLALLSFVIVVVNYWIYSARATFIELHPAFSAEQPPTISKAITDPSIGEPFAFWVTLSAVALAVGVLPVCWMHYRTARALPPGRTRSWLIVLAWAACFSQLSSCVGMVGLANWRGPDHGDGHMIGSYIFFGFQTLTVLIVAVMSHLLGKQPQAPGEIAPAMLSPRLSRFRSRFAVVSVVLALSFIGLFVTKGFDFEHGYALMYQVYVLSEPAAITCYLLVIVTYYPELWTTARSLSGSSRPLLSASRTHD